MNQITIYELLPRLRPGFVAMEKNGIWYWYDHEPVPDNTGIWMFLHDGDLYELSAFNIERFDGDWKDSLIKCGVYSIKWNSKDVMPHPKDTHHIITKSGFEYQWLPTRDWKNPKNNGWYSYETDKMFVDCPEDWMDYDVWKKSLFMKCGEKK